jgi:hypothetical protein
LESPEFNSLDTACSGSFPWEAYFCILALHIRTASDRRITWGYNSPNGAIRQYLIAV